MDKRMVLDDLKMLKTEMLSWLEYEEGRYDYDGGAILFEKDIDGIIEEINSLDEGAINDSEMSNLMSAQLQEDYGYSMLDAEAWVKNHGGCAVSDMWDAYSEYMNKNVDYSEEDE